MSIIRIKHNRENPFVQLNKKALWDENLSLKSVGLWARCMSRPDDWTFSVAELEKKCKEGKRAIYGAINELIENGYALRFQTPTTEENNGFSNVEYYFFEFSLTMEECEYYEEQFKKCLPQSGFAHTQDAHTQNAPLLIKKEKDIKEKNPPLTPPKDKTVKAKKDEEDFFGKLRKNLKQKNRNEESILSKAFEKLDEQPLGSIKKPLKWLEKVYDNLKLEKQMDLIVEARKRFCKNRGGNWVSGEEGVSIMSGAIETFYKYRGCEKFWEKYGLGKK